MSFSLNIIKNRFLIISLVLIGFVFIFLYLFVYKINIRKNDSFDGERALAQIEQQLEFGPRIPETVGHDKFVRWLLAELESTSWDASIQESVVMGHTIKNIVAKRNRSSTRGQWIIFSAHYDTRIYADESHDPEDKIKPVMGANDGASGVAVLLELARVIPNDFPGNIWLVFFDAEDNGRINGWDWILGSKAFVDQLVGKPDAVILVDMIGDSDLNIYMERNSDPSLSAEIWEQAAALGYTNYFIPIPKYRMLDDHIPFLQADIPAVDLIDFDYPYWHTVDDTLDKVSAESLKVVGDTLLAWLETKR
ncbi:MAG: M28 family peptidase [Chloroflexota bacterium]